MTTTANKQAEWDRLTEEIGQLEGRLTEGMKLHEASNNPDQRKRYYDKWIVILREYEGKCQERRALV